jgi:hypothetical protein
MRARAAATAVLLLAATACAAPRPPRPVPATHTLVPGSRISLALPPGFHHDPALPGYETADARTAIFVNEIPGSVYATLRSFSGEAFLRSGMRLHGHERVDVDGWPARLYRASQPVRDAELARLVLVFGDSSHSVVLTAVTPGERWEDDAPVLRAALLSARWHKDGVAPAAAAAEEERGRADAP